MWTGALYGNAKSAVLHPDVRDLADDRKFEAMLARTACASGAAHPLNRILYQDFKLYLEGDILAKVDRASMAVSLENRVPLLNPEVLAHLERIPLALKLRGLTRKFLLRKALEGRLPPSIIGRRKRGFSVPIATWLNDDLRDLTRDYLSEARLQREGLFQPQEVTRLLDEHARRVRNHAKSLWTILMFQLWRERWLDAA